MTAKRLRIADRDQIIARSESLEQLLPPEHTARAVWNFVAQLDLHAFLQSIRVDSHTPGQNAIDPRTLLTLWLLATLDGVASARQLENLCRYHLAYRWVCGDEPINYHTLADFRVRYQDQLDGLLTQSVAALVHAGVCELARVAQDGMRVRANAGASSFHREKTLQEHLVEAQEQVKALRSGADESPAAASLRSQAAQKRAATERVGRLEQALEHQKILQAENAERAESSQNRHRAKPPEKLRASSTDPEARRMKMADGGYRPAFNVQFATTVVGGVVVGVSLTNEGSDGEQLEPMLEQLETRHGSRPLEALVDGGYTTHEQIDLAERGGTCVYAPLKNEQKQLDSGGDPYAKKKGDSPAVATWRARMGTEEAKSVYRQRGQTAELVNAQARNRGLDRFLVRGCKKCLTVATWHALAQNLSRGIARGLWGR